MTGGAGGAGGGNRRFTASRKVRLGDVDPTGRLRLDSIARYLQDVANDDSVDAGEEPSQPWVVRRVRVSVDGWPRLHDQVELATWASGVGQRWAERSTSLVSAGGRVDAVALWVFVDAKTLVPARLPARFFDIWGHGLPKVPGRLTHADPPADSSVTWQPWPLRATDHDVLEHMNNAAYWEPVEEYVAGRGRSVVSAGIEYRTPITPGQEVSLGAADGRLWLCGPGGVVHATAVVEFA
jgi:acyl-ACP thioesterase